MLAVVFFFFFLVNTSHAAGGVKSMGPGLLVSIASASDTKYWDNPGQSMAKYKISLVQHI